MSVSAVQTIPPTARRELRLRLKPEGATGGYVDGAWWPRSRDLSAELPALAAVLASRLGSVWRVAYALGSWDAAPRRIQLDDGPVRLEGFHSQDKNSISVVALDRRRVRLLVIPSDVDEKTGNDALATASGPQNTETPMALLAATGAQPSAPASRGTSDSARDRWEGDGGHLGARRDLKAQR